MDTNASKGLSVASETLSRTLASFAHQLRFEDLPGTFVEFLKDHVIDTIGVALAATRFDFAARAAAGVAGLAGDGPCTVLGTQRRLPLRDAVLLNGVLAHGLDYDDTHPGGPVHPSASALPCALGVAELLRCSGRDLLLAYALGIEVATRLGLVSNGTMHRVGFHTTGVLGHPACAIAAGKLLGLTVEQLAWAQGLAGSMAAALAEHRADGAWSKRMHTGWAGVGGITAAFLAREGFVGTGRIYEGVDGLFRTHAGTHQEEVRYDQLTSGLGQSWIAAEVAVKPYPICHFLHACVDAALVLKSRYGLDARSVRQVRVLLHPETFHYVCDTPELKRRPNSDYIAKFSAYYTVAAALVRGNCGYAELEPAAIRDPRILELAQKVEYAPDPHSRFPRYFSGGVEITLDDGRSMSHHEPVNRGAGERQLTRDEIVRKFMANAEFALPRGRAEEMLEVLLHVERFDAPRIAQALSA